MQSGSEQAFWSHGQSGNGGTLSSGSWLSDVSHPRSQIGVGSRTRVHCSTRERARSRIVRKDAVTPKVRSFCTSNDAGPWRTSAKDDLAAIAAASGADLGSVVAPEMSYEEAKAIVRESELTLPGFDDTIRECGLSELEASQF